MGETQAKFYNLMPIIFFAILVFIAWKICKKARLNPYLSILIFISAIINQGLGLLTFIVMALFAGFKIIKAKKTKTL